MRNPRFRSLTFTLLLFLSFTLLAIFSVTTFMQASEIIDRQSISYANSLALRYEERLQEYLKRVEAEAHAMSADASQVSALYRGDLEAFRSHLRRWEEGYEQIHYDFSVISFPGQGRCQLSRSYVPELSGLECEHLIEKHEGASYQGWMVMAVDGETLAVYSIPLDLATSGKVVGQLLMGVRLAGNAHLLNHIMSAADPLHALRLKLNDRQLTQLVPGDDTDTRGVVEVESRGMTTLGPDLYLSLSINDKGQTALRQGLGFTLVYGVVLALLVSLLVAFWLSSSVDRQLQQLIGFTRLANRSRNASWKEMQIREFNQIGREVGEIVRCLKLREHELEEVNAELSTSITEKRSILQHLIQTQENERRRLSNELHDDMAQMLVAVKMNLQLLRDEMGDFKGQSQNLDQAVQLVNTIYDNVYHRIRTLRPYELSDFGLGVSLSGLPAIPILEQMDYAVEMDIRQERQLLPEVTSHLYRVAQEALSNVIKHAKGTYVLIRLRDEAEGLRLVIADDGVGAENLASRPGQEQGGFGLLAIRERAEYLGAELTLKLDGGVRVELFIPAQYAYANAGDEPEQICSA